MAKKSSAQIVLERIVTRGKEVGLKSDRQLSVAATGSTDTIASMRKQIKSGAQTSFKVSTLEKFAVPLKTTVHWISTGQGDPEDGSHKDSEAILGIDKPEDVIDVVGYVHAGGAIDRYPVGASLDTAPRPRGATDSTVAVEIRGTSLGKLLNRWLAYYDDVRRPITEDLFGKLCVVETEDGAVYVKRVRPARNNLFDLVPYEDGEPDIKNVKIKWAAKVTGFTPPR